MKMFPANFDPVRSVPRRARVQAFTLPEILIAMSIFLLVVAGVMSAHLFGLRMMQINSSKLQATAWSRETFGKITAEVHACNSYLIGSITNIGTGGIVTNGFQALMDGEVQQGSSLLIYPTTNTASYILYFLNASDQTFRRTTADVNSAVILAYSVTNPMPFTAQDYTGTVLTNRAANEVVHLTLDFYQPARFMHAPDYYQLETAVVQRVIP